MQNNILYNAISTNNNNWSIIFGNKLGKIFGLSPSWHTFNCLFTMEIVLGRNVQRFESLKLCIYCLLEQYHFFLFNEYVKHQLGKTFDNSNNIKSREGRRPMHTATVTYIGQFHQHFIEISLDNKYNNQISCLFCITVFPLWNSSTRKLNTPC